MLHCIARETRSGEEGDMRHYIMFTKTAKGNRVPRQLDAKMA